MELNVIKKVGGGGLLLLPPGFRFHPTDEELVVQYLKRKVHSFPLPASIIPDLPCCCCNSDPWDLPGDWEEERFFFSTREVKYPNGNRSNRATQSGYWKATGLDKQISSSSSPNQQVVIIGMKKTLVFYKGKPPTGSRTNWIMHEYRLLAEPPTTQQVKKKKKKQGMEKWWVLCRIFLKKRGGTCSKNNNKKKEEAIHDVKSKPPVLYDFLDTATPPKPNINKTRCDFNLVASSGSSGITDQDDTSSSSSSSFHF